MKIALIILHADPTRGGAERYTVDLAAGLVSRGHDVSLVACSFGNATAARQVKLPARSATRLGQYLAFLDAVEAHISTEHYDLVHAMLPVRHCDVYHPHAGLAAEAVVTGHLKYDGVRKSLAGITNRFNRKRQKFAAIERGLLEGPAVPTVLCLSEYIKATVRRQYKLPDEKLATLFNAVDLVKFDPGRMPEAGDLTRVKFGIDADCVVALMIAQDFQRKGLSEAIDALTGVDRRLVLFVVGKQKTAVYQKRAMRAGVADRVIFAGATNDPYSFYRAADFFVLPTRHDPCSLVVLESLAMGVPVISTIFNGACEIMTDGVHGFVLQEARDVGALHERYIRMLDDANRKRMSEACLELRPQLSQEHHLDRLLAVYQECMNREMSLRPFRRD